MLLISQIVLALASLFAALLLYRQPNKLTAQSKTLAHLVTICVLLIFISSFVPIFVTEDGEDSRTFLLILTNLQLYLALPLMSSLVFCHCLNKHFSKGTWGRGSLVLLASFELCRRAEVGDYYSAGIAISCSLLIAGGFMYQRSRLVLPLVQLVTIASYSMALIIFSTELSPFKVSNDNYYNILLGLAICLICYCFGKNLSTTPRV